MQVLKSRLGFCVGIHAAYSGMNKLAAAHGELRALHECTTPHKNLAWDTLRRIEARDPSLFGLYPELEKVAIVHDHDGVRNGDRVALGFHGVEKGVKERLLADGAILHDFQCPYIARMNEVVEELTSDGYGIIAFGKLQNHHCLYAKKISSEKGLPCVIVQGPVDLDGFQARAGEKWACVAQVTGNTLLWKQVEQLLRERHPSVRIVDTVCSDSHLRQEEAARLARQADLTLVMDDGGGSSLSVYEAVAVATPRAHRIGSKEDIRSEWFDGADKVAVVGGILVPQWTIDSIVEHLTRMFPSTEPTTSADGEAPLLERNGRR